MDRKNNEADLEEIKYYIGTKKTLEEMPKLKAFQPFAAEVISYLNALSKELLRNKKAKVYPDVVTFGFWCRKAAMEELKKDYTDKIEHRYGRGIAFHIAPSNVPVNFAYSMVAGLLAGNANIGRLPSKEYEQVDLIIEAMERTLGNPKYENLRPYFCLIKYGHSEKITEYLSALCDTRIIWGGNQTIETIRRAALKPRAIEVTFADRYSMAIINADQYLEAMDKEKIARGFYNDTYLTDQNACTSPRIIFWMGNHINEAQEEFWKRLNTIVEKEYNLQGVQAVSKLTTLCELGATHQGVHQIITKNNLTIRVALEKIEEDLMDYRGNSGYFMECRVKNLDELLPLCKSQCQTLSYYGVDLSQIEEFLRNNRPQGIDRVVPIGKTMDFELVWDGVDLIERLTRVVKIIYDN
ncbi:acyl-CoA reductase [Acetobacterium fimetarium]|nr:acyl-CoA reductase [Acetobacterium fimetarium]